MRGLCDAWPLYGFGAEFAESPAIMVEASRGRVDAAAGDAVAGGRVGNSERGSRRGCCNARVAGGNDPNSVVRGGIVKDRARSIPDRAVVDVDHLALSAARKRLNYAAGLRSKKKRGSRESKKNRVLFGHLDMAGCQPLDLVRDHRRVDDAHSCCFAFKTVRLAFHDNAVVPARLRLFELCTASLHDLV